ncbi:MULTISPECIES: recombinase RecT [Butyricimonas]|uniref:recombinase RecT n=1 Tax=Butyricimonas TaxID=574697 RepID=UPI0007FB3DC5|nr:MULTISPECIES: recombinase RecT [Butyricimonas]
MENNSNEQKLTIDQLKPMKPLEVLENKIVRERFISLYNRIHDSENGELFFEQEKYNLQRIIQATPALSSCNGFSIYGIMLDIANMGLTLENNSRPLLYVIPNSVNVGTKDKQVWEKRATIEISPYGELDLRIQAGQLLYADRPVVVFEGDEFQPRVTETGQKVVVYSASIPRKSKTIIGAFIKLTRPDGSFDFFWMLPEDIDRLKGYSLKKNQKRDKDGNVYGDSNALYKSNNGQIDTGFLEAKVIKHAFKTFPKLKLGQFSKLQEEAQAIDYGLDEPVYNQVPVEEEEDKERATAEEIANQEGGVTIVDNPDEPF